MDGAGGTMNKRGDAPVQKQDQFLKKKYLLFPVTESAHWDHYFSNQSFIIQYFNL